MRIHSFKNCSSLLLRSLIALAAMAAGAVMAQTQGVTDTEIVLGSVTDLSGPVASVGIPQRDGMILAVEELNAAGGIQGRKLRLLVEDSAMDPKRAILVTQKLLTQDKVFALVGTMGSAATQATLPLALERNVPMLFPFSASDISYLPHNPLKFGLFSLSSDLTSASVRHAYEKLGRRRFGILYQDDEYGQSVLRSAEAQLKEHGLTIIERTSFKRGDTNFSAQIARLKAAKVDVVLLGATPRDGAAAEIESKAQAWSVDMYQSGGSPNASIISLGGQAVEGMWCAGQFANAAQRPSLAYSALTERYRARFGHDVQDGVNYGYLSVMLFAEGVKNAGRGLTPLTLSQGLEKVKNFTTPFQSSPVSYKPGDHSPPRDAMMMQVKGGKWTIIE